MNNNRLYLDIHAIQTLPPSNINRDDTGSPKTAMYGGVRRARVSSQSWKKAMRDYFNEKGEIKNVGKRTLDIVTYVANKICALDIQISMEKAMEMADAVINNAGVKTKKQKAKALFFMGEVQAQNLAKAAINGEKDKKQLQEILKNNPSIDIALFGRMVADDASLNEDASAQVAHSISTHAIENEFDFYTALDDLSPEESAGAGMLGNIEFNSSTLYRYANVAVHDLQGQLKDKTATINSLKLFVEAFVNSMPTGKINTFANQTLPQLLVVSIRNDRPVNLVSAFEKPVKSAEGYIEQSIKKLCKEYEKTEKFVNKPLKTFYISLEELSKKEDNELLNELLEKDTLSALLQDLGTSLNELM